MSCFPGRMNEYRFLSIDRFDGDNLLSRIYFLSHAHEDHMVGLDSPRLKNHLAANNLRLYVHKVTFELLLHDKRYRHLKPYMEPLEVDEPHMLTAPKGAASDNEDTITVTLLSAGHCPGSVMFLFEGADGTVLYTGDIRLNQSDLVQMPALMSGSEVKSIRSMYFDSTFCTPDMCRIVDRRESLKSIVQLTKAHLNAHPLNRVLLDCAQRYGHEFLMYKLSQELETKVHVSGPKEEIYKKLANIGQCFTTDALRTRIHACSFYEAEDDPSDAATKNEQKSSSHRQYSSASSASCPHCRPGDHRVMVIRPSMLWFYQSRSIRDVVHYDSAKGIYRVQYSCHSSLEEIRGMLKFLRPQNSYPNVVPFRSKDYAPVYRAIADIDTNIGYSSPRKRRQLTSIGTSTSEEPQEKVPSFGVVSNFSNRKRIIEAAMARRRLQTAVLSPKASTNVSTSAKSASFRDECRQVSDSDPSSQENEECDGDSSDSDFEITFLRFGDIKDDGKSNVNNDPPATEKDRSLSSPCEKSDQNGGTQEQHDEISDAVNDVGPLNQVTDSTDASYDYDIDLFDTAPRQDPPDHTVQQEDDDLDSAPPLSKSDSQNSVEFLGCFQKSAEPPVVVLSSPEDSVTREVKKFDQKATSLQLLEEKQKSPIVDLEPSTSNSGKKKRRPAKPKQSRSAPQTCSFQMAIDEDDEDWLRQASLQSA